MMMPTLRMRAVQIAMKIFTFANSARSKELFGAWIVALDTIGTVTTEINLHPDITIVAVEVEVAFLVTTVAFATTIHFLIVFVAFGMDSVMAVALRFRILANNHRSRRRRWRRRLFRRWRWLLWRTY